MTTLRCGIVCIVVLAGWTGLHCHFATARAVEPAIQADDDDGDFARKADIMHGARWQRTIAEFGGWLTTQTLYSPADVQRIKREFNARVAAMSSYELEYLLDSISAKLQLLDTPEARDAKAWLGEYLSAMSDARRAEALRTVPDLLDMNATQLWQEIQRVDRLRTTLRERQQASEARQSVLAQRATAGRQATAAASQAAAARARSAPAHSPYRQGGGSPPFADAQRRQPVIPFGIFGGFMF
ncbi:MAG: hypothetical protein ACKOOF_11045 [Planctomycetaceae bacterium]